MGAKEKAEASGGLCNSGDTRPSDLAPQLPLGLRPESTSLDSQLFCILLMAQSQQRRLNVLFVVVLKPCMWMKQNWGPAPDSFIVQVTRSPTTC